MTNLPSQADSKSQVLRLKELLGQLRTAIEAHLPADSTVDQVAKFFGVEWSTARRFWEKGSAAGPVFINAVGAKLGSQHLTREIVKLLESLPERSKALVPYPVGAIELAFDITAAFARAQNQQGIVQREQMNGKEFAAFFGVHREFVHALTGSNRQVLRGYTDAIGQEIQSVLKATDWSSIRPTPIDKSQPAEFQPSSLSTVQESHVLIGAMLSQLNSLVRTMELLRLNHDLFTDGHRDNLLRAVGKLLALAKIDKGAITRLLSREGLKADDPVLVAVLAALSGDRR